MFGSISERGGHVGDDDDATTSAEKIRKLFDLPEAENVVTGLRIEEWL
jgi:hypothetical protein